MAAMAAMAAMAEMAAMADKLPKEVYPDQSFFVT